MILFIMRDEEGDWFEQQINKTFGKAIYEMVTMIRIGYTYTCHTSPPVSTPRSQWSKLVPEATQISWDEFKLAHPSNTLLHCDTRGHSTLDIDLADGFGNLGRLNLADRNLSKPLGSAMGDSKSLERRLIWNDSKGLYDRVDSITSTGHAIHSEFLDPARRFTCSR